MKKDIFYIGKEDNELNVLKYAQKYNKEYECILKNDFSMTKNLEILLQLQLIETSPEVVVIDVDSLKYIDNPDEVVEFVNSLRYTINCSVVILAVNYSYDSNLVSIFRKKGYDQFIFNKILGLQLQELEQVLNNLF